MAFSADYYEQLREKSEREDIVMFINSCFAATGQNEYYSDRYTDAVSIDFLHQYMLVNYRTVYCRVLAAGINHFSQTWIIRNLLQAGAPEDSELRREEGQLIAATLRRLPPNRVFKLFARLRADSINNRRTRAVVRDYLAFRGSDAFSVVKYRNKLRTAIRHAHAPVDDETARFLFSFHDCKQFAEPLFDTFRRAHFSKQAVFELPFTVAEGLAARHGIDRSDFLRKIAPMMTRTEKLRLQNAAARAKKVMIEVDLATAPLTQLAIYILSLPLEQRQQQAEAFHAALTAAAERIARRSSLHSRKAAVVLDRSRSTWGSRERRRRPLAIAVAMHYLLAAACSEFRSFWTPSPSQDCESYGADDHVFLMAAGGQTDLATPLLDAIQWQPDELLIVSDGHENAPAGAADQIVQAYRRRLQETHPITFVHANPVFDADHFSPRRLGNAMVTIGVREAEDLPAAIRFAKFAAGEASQSELEDYLRELAEAFIERANEATRLVDSTQLDTQ